MHSFGSIQTDFDVEHCFYRNGTTSICYQTFLLISKNATVNVEIAQCTVNVNEYLKMNVKTSITYQPTDSIEFPSIMLCSTYPFKRSEFGNYTFASQTLSESLAMNENELTQLYKINQRTCQSDYESTYVKLLHKYTFEYFLNGSATPEFFYNMLAPSLTNFQTDVEKCWVNNVEVDCYNVLINRPSEDSICFSYNLGNEISKILINTSLVIKQNTKRSNWTDNSFPTHTRRVRFLLKANQSDNCGTGLIKRGSGYFAILSDRDATPISMFNAPINLTPGYINNVMIKPIKYNRKTEKMGLCRNQSNIFLLPTSEKYMQSVCQFQCIMGAILKKCKCYPPNQIVFHNLFLKNLKNFNISKEDISYCNALTEICARNVQTEEFIDSNIDKRCPECTFQCIEYKYDYELTHLSMTVSSLQKDVPESIVNKLGLKNLTRNYVDSTFSFKSDYVEIVEESQAVTIIDLFINLGNNIGLFLGMSFMSVFEITNDIIFPLFISGVYRIWRSLKMLSSNRRRTNSNVVFIEGRQLKMRKRRKCSQISK